MDPNQTPKLTDTQKAEIRERMEKASGQVMWRCPYHGALLATMKLIEDERMPAPMATDCVRRVWWNPNLLHDWTWKEMAFGLMHEAEHKARMYPFRLQHRIPVLFNVACDATLNRDLKRYIEAQSLPFTVPTEKHKAPVFFDWVDDTMTDEDVYERLLQQCKDNAKGQKGKGDPTEGFNADVFGIPEDATETEVMQDILNAEEMAKQRGTLPGHVKSIVDKIPEALHDWKTELAKELRAALGADDWTYNPIRTSAAARGFLLPTLHGHKVGHVVFIGDTSGSMVALISQVFGEAKGILTSCQPEKLTFIHADADVQHVQEYTNPAEMMEPEWHGGGGTSFVPAIAKAAEVEADVVIYATDGCGDYPEEPPFKVLWVLIGKGTMDPPWGKIVRVYQ